MEPWKGIRALTEEEDKCYFECAANKCFVLEIVQIMVDNKLAFLGGISTLGLGIASLSMRESVGWEWTWMLFTFRRYHLTADSSSSTLTILSFALAT